MEGHLPLIHTKAPRDLAAACPWEAPLGPGTEATREDGKPREGGSCVPWGQGRGSLCGRER